MEYFPSRILLVSKSNWVQSRCSPSTAAPTFYMGSSFQDRAERSRASWRDGWWDASLLLRIQQTNKTYQRLSANDRLSTNTKQQIGSTLQIRLLFRESVLVTSNTALAKLEQHAGWAGQFENLPFAHSQCLLYTAPVENLLQHCSRQLSCTDRLGLRVGVTFCDKATPPHRDS